MRILLDTNIVLDILLEREENLSDSLSVINKALEVGDRLLFSCSSLTDVFYIVNKNRKDRYAALECVKRLNKILNFATVDANCIVLAMNSNLKDFEDAVVDAVAINARANAVITRNIKDFKGAYSKVLSPQEYLELYF